MLVILSIVLKVFSFKAMFRIISQEVVQIVDTASLYYESQLLNFDRIKSNIEIFLGMQGKTEKEKNNKIIFRTAGQRNLNYINFISLAELKKNIRITISFSYSRYKKTDNYELCENEKTIGRIHAELAKILKIITEKPVLAKDLKIATIDISNQLEVPNVSSYYKCKDIIYRALKLTETNGRLYFDTGEDKRKTLDGLDFREQGKRRREANTYFKIYSKRKEEERTGKDPRGHATALRGELTLKGAFLKKHHFQMAAGITRENLDRILYNELAETLAEGIEKELNYSITHLATLLKNHSTNKIREILTINEHHIFDVKILDIILIPENIGVSERQCRTYKKQVKEILQEIENQGEIKKNFTGNFERLTKLLRKVAKMELSFEFTEKGVVIKWERLQNKEK